MAIINSYPGITELKPGSLLLVSDTSVEGNPTKTATIDNLISLIPPLVPGGGTMIDWEFIALPGPSTARTVTNNDRVTFEGVNKISCATTGGPLRLQIDHDATTRTDTTSTAAPASGATFTCIDSITQDATGHPTAVNVKTVTMPLGTRPYKVYSALLSQSGSTGIASAPTATVLENSIPGTFVWTRQAAGEYQFTSTTTTPFPSGRTQVFINNGLPVANSSMIKWERLTDDKIGIKTVDLSGSNVDDLLVNGSIEIRVY